MTIILCRHGATTKNLEGGTDDRWTGLHAEGLRQASETGSRLAAFCKSHGIARVQPITSGYDRTNATAEAALQTFADKTIEILPRIEDDRIGEIKFCPRTIHPTAARPGIFNRVIDGPTLEDVLAALTTFDADCLCADEDPNTAIVVFGHRTTHRLLAMIHLARDIGWMEAMPRMDNCELWLLGQSDISVLHPGYPAGRDEPDPRRDSFK